MISFMQMDHADSYMDNKLELAETDDRKEDQLTSFSEPASLDQRNHSDGVA